MIEKTEMNQLFSVSDLKSKSDNAPFEIEEQAIAVAINTAANTGEKSCIYTHDISPKVIEDLISKGYKLYPRYLGGAVAQYEINWREYNEG